MKFSKALRYTLIFAGVGILVVFLIVFVQRNAVNTYSQNLPYARLADHVKNRATQAHLWLEELLAGDQTLRFDKNVLGPLRSCQQILQGAYDGTATELGDFDKPTDEETMVLLKQALVDVEKLIGAAKEKWEAEKQNMNSPGDSLVAPSSAGAEDQKFDALYTSFHTSADRLSEHFRKKTVDEINNASALSWIASGGVLTSVVFLSLLIYRRQSANDKTESESSKKLEEETRRVNTMSQFIEAVSAGNYDVELTNASDDDSLTSKLVGMRDKLKRNSDDDRKRNWSTSGLAQIGEILRAASTTTTELYDSIIRFVVKYTKSNQGGLFILNEDSDTHKFLELVACYAFERKKYLTRQVEIGDGLIGQCFLEGQRIYLLEVPQEYIRITSGLGGTNPNALLIVPLKVNDQIYGVLELASFNKYQDYEIELVEKLAESIASTVSSVRVNDTTRQLLERTQQQAEEMKSQEEEIRQNMEELEATQEEMRRKQTILEKELKQSQQQSEALRQQEKKLIESQDTLQAIVDHIPRAIFWKDKELRFMGCNKIFASIAGATSPQELIGKTDFDMAWSAQADAYRKDDLEVMKNRNPKLDIEEVNINSDGEESWVLTSKVPIINNSNEVVAILGMFEDITARKRREADVTRKLAERESALKELASLKQLLETRKA